jgi:hypothetical protein
MSESQFQHGWNVYGWSETSVSAWLECIAVRKFNFSMSGTGLGHKCLFQHAWVKIYLKKSLKVLKTS